MARLANGTQLTSGDTIGIGFATAQAFLAERSVSSHWSESGASRWTRQGARVPLSSWLPSRRTAAADGTHWLRSGAGTDPWPHAGSAGFVVRAEEPATVLALLTQRFGIAMPVRTVRHYFNADLKAAVTKKVPARRKEELKKTVFSHLRKIAKSPAALGIYAAEIPVLAGPDAL